MEVNKRSSPPLTSEKAALIRRMVEHARQRPRDLSSSTEETVIRTGTIMGSAMLALSLLNLLPLPATLQDSMVVNALVAGVGALCGGLAMRPRKEPPPSS